MDDIILKAFNETVFMTFYSTIFSVIFGFILAVILAGTSDSPATSAEITFTYFCSNTLCCRIENGF